MNILIAGGSGLLGAHLTSFLVREGHMVRHLSRKKHKHMQAEVFEWDIPRNFIEPEALTEVDVVINLAGAGVADKKWSKKRKSEILSSRVDAINCLFENLNKIDTQPSLIINASAIGYYGDLSKDVVSKESDPSGDTFLANVCEAWERETLKLKSACKRLAILRIGVVLSDRGGALPKMMNPIQYFVGSSLGSGQQSVNWIHVEDLCRLIDFTINNQKVEGIYNAVSSLHVTNHELTMAIAKKTNRPIWLPNVPSFALKMALGEMAQMVLEGNPVSNQKILNTGFEFKYQCVTHALDELLREE